MNLIYVLLIIGVVLVFWVISTYNFFVSSKTRVGAAIQEIGNQLKRQAELIPNLESSAKGYLTHEKEIFNELTAARKAISSAVSSGNVNKIQVVVESNPEIKGAEVVKDLMDQLRDTSDKVMYARRLMIDLTADYNVKLVTVPSSLVAGLFHFEKLKGFETPEDGAEMKVTGEEMKTPKVKL